MSQRSGRELELEFHTYDKIQSTKATIDRLINDQARIKALQTLSVRSSISPRDDDPDGTRYQDLINSLIQLFEGGKDVLENFQTLEWDADGGFPPSLLSIFETHHPSWNIHLRSNPERSSILSSPAVTSLAVRLNQSYIADGGIALSNIQRAIQDSKNVKRLHLSVDVHGCSRSHYNTDFSENGETFPPLEELVLEWFSITQSCGEYWLKAMDWSRLRVLDLREGSFSDQLLSLLLPVKDKLPALESIGMHLPRSWTKDSVQEQRGDPNSFLSVPSQFFSTARPQSLLGIRLQGYYRSLLPEILNNQAASLKSLSLHDQEVSRKDCQRIPLSLEELEEIGTKSPGLEILALDVNISKEHTWPRDILDALASPKFSSLKKLTVFSLIGIAGEMTEQPEGELGFALATAEEDVKNLCSSLSTTPLREIEVQIGEERTIRGRPASWVLWEMSERKVLTMRKEGDGRAFSPVGSGHDI